MHLPPDLDLSVSGEPWTPPLVGTQFADLGLCGASFGRGTVRFHNAVTGAESQALVEAAFPELAGHVGVFAVDWRGRQLAIVDSAVSPTETDDVALVDVGAGEYDGIADPVSFVEGFDTPGLEDVLAAEDLWAVLDANAGLRLRFDQCLGYERPLYFGGEDSLSNMEQIDISVYWTVFGQLLEKSRGMEPGQGISGVSG